MQYSTVKKETYDLLVEMGLKRGVQQKRTSINFKLWKRGFGDECKRKTEIDADVDGVDERRQSLYARTLQYTSLLNNTYFYCDFQFRAIVL